MVKVWADHHLARLLEELAHLVVDAVLDTKESRDPDLVLSVHHREELLELEALCVKDTRVALDFWRSLYLHLGSVLEHLSAHLCNGFASVLLQFDEGCDNVVLELADELFSGVTKGIYIVHVGNQVDDNVAFRGLSHN